MRKVTFRLIVPVAASVLALLPIMATAQTSDIAKATNTDMVPPNSDASAPSPDTAKPTAEPLKPAPPIVLTAANSATLTIYRSDNRMIADSFQPTIFLDGKPVTRIHNGSFFALHVKPGKHVLTIEHADATGPGVFEAGKTYFYRYDPKQKKFSKLSPNATKVTLFAPVDPEIASGEMQGLRESD